MSFVLVTSFFIYYLIYIFVPVAGPQFYFPAIGFDNVSKGIFPAIGDYFNNNQELLPGPGYQHGFFYSLVEGSAASGRASYGRFPQFAGHGISTILMIMAGRGSNESCLPVLDPFLYAALQGLPCISGTLRYRCDRRFLLCILVVCCGDVDVQEVVCAADV